MVDRFVFSLRYVPQVPTHHAAEVVHHLRRRENQGTDHPASTCRALGSNRHMAHPSAEQSPDQEPRLIQTEISVGALQERAGVTTVGGFESVLSGGLEGLKLPYPAPIDTFAAHGEAIITEGFDDEVPMDGRRVHSGAKVQS